MNVERQQKRAQLNRAKAIAWREMAVANYQAVAKVYDHRAAKIQGRQKRSRADRAMWKRLANRAKSLAQEHLTHIKTMTGTQ